MGELLRRTVDRHDFETVVSQRDTARTERDRYRLALERIAQTDYRGNRSIEQQIAADALAPPRPRPITPDPGVRQS